MYGDGNILNIRKSVAADGHIYITAQVDTDGKEYILQEIVPESPHVRAVPVRLSDRNATLYYP